MLRLNLFRCLLLATALALAGCRYLQTETELKQPAQATVTAQVPTVQPTATPKPQLGPLAFVQGGDIWVKELPDGEARRLTQDGRNDTPLWSRAGKWLTFRKDNKQYWVMRADGGDARELYSDTTAPPAWSPVEERLALAVRGGLVTELANGGERRQLVPEGWGVAKGGAGGPVWSPDGQWLAFARVETLQEAQPFAPPLRYAALGKVNVSTGEVLELVNAGRPSGYGLILAGWSPDGSQILYWIDPVFSASILADGVPLMRVPVGGGLPAEITSVMLPRAGFLAWSPDGLRLALVDGGYRSTWWDNKKIAVATIAGRLQDLGNPGWADLFPAWSPDGRWIAFTRGPAPRVDGGPEAKVASDGRRIWVMQPDGSDKHPLTNDPNYRDEYPLWSADGKFILFARFQGEGAQLWLMRADGSDQRRMVDELSPSPSWFGYYGYINWGRLYDWRRSRSALK